jgi:hypothetical protein
VTAEIQVALQDKYKQVLTFVRYVEKGPFIEFGGMLHALRLAAGRTGSELGLLRAFRSFICDGLLLPALLEEPLLETCAALVAMRNPAAHASSAPRNVAVEARSRCFGLMRALSRTGNA